MTTSIPPSSKSLEPSAHSVPPPSRSGNVTKQRRKLGVTLGVLFSVTFFAAMLPSRGQHLRTPGQMNTGHELVECADCHRAAPGTLRQQLQANVRYLLGLRRTAVEFGAKPVSNQDCLACHERPFDRHPVFRFNEPRFEAARRELGPQNCTSCHAEHNAARVTVGGGFCVQCHSDMFVHDDPLDVPHDELAATERWDTCLGCHDFHSGHVFELPTALDARIDAQSLDQYFSGGPNPYPARPRSTARAQRPKPPDEQRDSSVTPFRHTDHKP